MFPRRLCRQALAGLCLLTAAGACQAAEPAQRQVDPVHWAFAAFLGSGWYRLGQEQDVFVLRVPPRWRYREPDPQADGRERLGVEFQFPMTLGLHRLEEFGDFLDTGNIGTVSFTPGVEVEYPFSARWRLRWYGHLGWGTDTEGRESAWMVDSGIKSRLGFRHGSLDWGLVSEVFYAGYRSSLDRTGSLGGVLAGLDFSHPVSALRSGRGEPLDLKWDLTYTWFGDNPLFQLQTGSFKAIEDAWAVGVAFARRAGPTRIGRFKFARFGLSYRFSSDGEFRAITLNFRAPFDR